MDQAWREQVIPANIGRRRVNINGAIDLERLEPVVRCHGTINADSTIALFEQLAAFHPMAVCIHVICDNTPYYRSKALQDYLKASRIQLVFLPPYALNLNLIERLWRFFKKRVLYNWYYETFVEFRAAREIFFKSPHKYQPELHSLLTANVEIIN